MAPAPILWQPNPALTDSDAPIDPIADNPDPTTDDPVTTNDQIAPQITELLPNPASPQTDADDEFIEPYNPSTTSDFNLKGYTLEVGTTTLHDFTFTSDTIVPAASYLAFTSAQTGLAMSNSGGQARLLSPMGQVLNQTASYTTAADGQAWALDAADATWYWTTAPTPGAVNIITAAAGASTAVSTTKPAAKATAKKTTETAAVKGVKTTKAKKPKAAKKTKSKK